MQTDANLKYLPLFAALVTIIACLVWSHPCSRDTSHFFRAMLAISGVAIIIVRYSLMAQIRSWFGEYRALVKPIYLSLLSSLVVLGVFNYYQFDKKFANGFDDYSDIIHYYLNTKYLPELGYYDLYAAMLVADLDSKGRHGKHIKTVRDLRDDTLKPAALAVEAGEYCRDNNFTQDRWAEFKTDVSYFMDRVKTGMLSEVFFVDHGFNPPATWSTLAEPLVRLFGVEYLKYAASIDAVLIAAMFVAVWWAFGLETALLTSIFLLSTFSGRWPVLTHSLLRFDWISSLVIGVAMLKKHKYALGGGFMAAAALSRVFPLLFFVPVIVAASISFWERDRLGSVFRRYFLGAGWVTVVILAATIFLFGAPTVVESAKSVIHHGKAFSSHRVGLGCAVLYRGEWTRQDVREDGGIPLKQKTIRDLQPFFWGLAILTIGLIAWYIWRRRPVLWETVHLGALPLFCISNLQVNYYNFRALFIIYHFYLFRKNPRFHFIALSTLFLLEAGVQLAHCSGAARHAVNSLTSIGLLAYFALMIGWLFEDGRTGQSAARRTARDGYGDSH